MVLAATVDGEICRLELLVARHDKITFSDRMVDILGLDKAPYSLATNSKNVEPGADENLRQNKNFYSQLSDAYEYINSVEGLEPESDDEENRARFDTRDNVLYVRGTSPIFPNAGMTKLFVYTDIIRP